MIGFLRAHGIDPGPLQRPILAGLLAGVAGAAAAAPVFLGLQSFSVAADRVMRLPRPTAGLLILAAFAAAGAVYGLILRRAANDRRGGWLFGAVFGFIFWVAAPILVLPLLSGQVMAAGRAAAGFLATFVIWGAVTGAAFPLIHRPLQQELNGEPTRRRKGQGGSLSRALFRRRRPF